MELEMYCTYKSLEIRKAKTGDNIYYFLSVIQNGKEVHLCIFEDKVFENAVDSFKTLSVNTPLKIVCNYNYRNNKANLIIVSVNIWNKN